MAKKRKTLPKHFNELLESGDISALQKVFDTCDLNAYGGYSKATALSFHKVPDELVSWLVEQGADIDAVDTYKRTALHSRASSWHGNVGLLLRLGASINARDYQGDTPLHMAAGSFKPTAVRELVAHGADIHAKNMKGRTPLEKALAEGNNASIESIAEIADILLEAGEEITPDMAASVTRLGKSFEFHRENFNKDRLEATYAALTHLYDLFHVSPVERRVIHDGASPITVKANRWQTQHQELWEMLVPSQGAAKTIQGEVIRITGKVSNEILGNGSCNWDSDFKKMLDALLKHLGSGTKLDEPELQEAGELVKQVRGGNGDQELSRLTELSVRWVLRNPIPVALREPDYTR